MNFPFYIAKRYLFSKKSHNAINVISAISVCGVALATLALVCTLSVFNGFQDLVATFFTAFDPELKITAVTGKVFDGQEARIEALRRMPEIAVFSESLTFAGNGEPTAHPHFAGIIEDTLALRDIYFPQAKVSVLSNSTFIHKPEVFDALNKIDNNILKLDTIDTDYIRLTDRPTGHYDVRKIIKGMKAFKGNLIIQTMFMKGKYQGQDVDNTSDRYVLPWLETVKEIAPRQVMIYTIDRETPDHDLEKATHEELDRIGKLIKDSGIPVSVSY